MSFVQMFQFTTSDVEGIRRVDEEWRKATEGKRTVRREVIAADRNQPGRYFAIVFFDSYESAMENSNLPERRPPPRSTWSFRRAAGLLRPRRHRGPDLTGRSS